MSFNERTIALIGEDNVKKIASKKVIVFGVGGVGGYVLMTNYAIWCIILVWWC